MEVNRPTDIRKLSSVVSAKKRRTCRYARSGNPDALREVLSDLAGFLRGEVELDERYASFCAESLKNFVNDLKVWKVAQQEFESLDHSKVSVEERVARRGPRLSLEGRRKIGSAFCRAFLVSRPQGKKGYHSALMPMDIKDIAEVRQYGESLNQAIKIVGSTRDLEMSSYQIKEWFRRKSLGRSSQSNPSGYPVGERWRWLRLATHVLRRTVRGMPLQQACEEVSQIAIKEFCSLPTATVFLKPETVRRAYDSMVSSDDPLWLRVERFVRHCAAVEQADGS